MQASERSGTALVVAVIKHAYCSPSQILNSRDFQEGISIFEIRIDRIARRCILLRMGLKNHFKGAKLIRMSSGDYCIVRDLGLVPGGKGMRHHDNLLTLTFTGIAARLVGSWLSSAADSDRGLFARFLRQ